MALITYPLNNIQYSAEDAEIYNATRMSGVYSGIPFNYSVVEGTNEISVGEGLAWINNGKFTGKTVANKEAVSFDFGIAPSAQQRIDVLALQFKAADNETNFVIKKGVPSDTPEIPEIVQTESVYELYLFSVLRRAGAATIASADVTDLRDNRKYCGYMQDSIKPGYAPSLMEHNKGEDMRVWKGKSVDFDEQYASGKIPAGTLAIITDEVDPIKELKSYGLGGVAKKIDSADSATNCGWYYTNSGYVFILNRMDGDVKNVFELYVNKSTGEILTRNRGGDPDGYRVLNPRLNVGVEVATNDMFLNKTIYTKLVPLGSIGAGETKTISHGADVETMLSCELIDYSSGRLISHYGKQVESVAAGRSNIEISLKSGAASIESAYAIIKYTKR